MIVGVWTDELPIGGEVDVEGFARWVREHLDAATREAERCEPRKESEEWARAVTRWSMVNHTREAWLEYRASERGGLPCLHCGSHRRHFEDRLWFAVVLTTGALRDVEKLEQDTIYKRARAQSRLEWACRILAQYAGLDWLAVRGCGDDLGRFAELLRSRRED